MNKLTPPGSPKFNFAQEISDEIKKKLNSCKSQYLSLVQDLSVYGIEKITKCKRTYINLTIESIESRFKEVNLIISLSIFNPSCATSTTLSLETYSDNHVINPNEKIRLPIMHLNKKKLQRAFSLRENAGQECSRYDDVDTHRYKRRELGEYIEAEKHAREAHKESLQYEDFHDKEAENR
ncbi:MAG: hypothetical protein EZS28_022512 [Streblomastix strix]|uniref:Uncharacterized protein n=1 Tax=Streblomastix strix TaxID=222440 RepID=A0A5J4VHG9_9EUKA|nr:MAG: hypothetical protein EZS28_022512 [Streblomastix strix]